MAQFANPLFGDASRQLERFSQNRLRAPILEGQLRQSLALARRQNALAGLDEQTFGSNAAVRDQAMAGPGDDPSGFIRSLAALTLGGSNAAAIRNLPATLSTFLSIPDTAASVSERELADFQVGTGVQSAQNTFTGLDRVLAERAAGRRGGVGGRGGGGGGGDLRTGLTLTAGGRTKLDQALRRIIDREGVGDFSGADTILFDAAKLVERIMNEAAARGEIVTENDAIGQALQMLQFENPTDDRPGNFFTRNLPFIGGPTGTELEAFDAANTGSLSFADQVTDALTGPGDPETGVRADPVPDTPAVVPEQSLPNGMTVQDVVRQAREAIAAGKDPAIIADRLRAMGVNPAVLNPATPFDEFDPNLAG